MKKVKILSLIMAGALVLSIPVLISGCATTPAGTKVLDPQLAVKLAPVLRSTASAAVIYGYTQNKTSAKYLDAVKVVLQEFILGTDLSPTALQAKLNALPIKELKTPEAQLIITPVLSAYKAYAENYVQNGLVDQVGWKVLVKALTDGIDDGLQAVAVIQAAAAPPATP